MTAKFTKTNTHNKMITAKRIGQVIIVTAITLFTSCGKSEREIKAEKEKVVEQEKKELKEQLKTTNEKAIIDLTHKYNAISSWDTLDKFTYVFQEMFIDEKKNMSFEGELVDITKSDSTYFLKVYKDTWHYDRFYIAQISTTPEQFSELERHNSTEGCFIIKVTQITSLFDLEGEDSDLTCELDDHLLIFKGDLIDFYLNETVENK